MKRASKSKCVKNKRSKKGEFADTVFANALTTISADPKLNKWRADFHEKRCAPPTNEEREAAAASISAADASKRQKPAITAYAAWKFENMGDREAAKHCRQRWSALIRSGGAAFTQQWQLKADELNKRNKLVAPPGELSYQIFRLDNLAEGLFPRDAAALN
jgi:hypothetical protein